MAAKTGPTSFGYQRHNSRLIAHPVEAPIRRRMFALFAEHRRKKTVAEILNAEGATTRTGSPFTGQTVGRLLQEEKVTGIPREVEALVSKELFDRCKAILVAQRSAGGARRKTAHLFSGLVFCQCGQKMYVPSNTQKYVCGDCRRKIPTDDLEAVFATQLKHCELPSELAESFSQVGHRWSILSFDDKREIIECVTERIDIGDKKVTCSFVSL